MVQILRRTAQRSACLGGKTLAADVTLDDFTLNVSSVKALCRKYRIKAIIAVNMFGNPAQMAELKALGVPILEDCAHGFGVSSGGRPLGGRGDAGILSFYATKLIGAGEGGAVLTDEKDVADSVHANRDYTNKPKSAFA